MTPLIFAAAFFAASPLHLSDLLREAREKNPEILAARASRESMDAAVRPSGALDDPMLMFQLWNAPADFSNVPIMAQLHQSLPLGGKRGARRAEAAADAGMARADADMHVLDVLAEVSKSYFDLFVAERSLEVDLEIETTAKSLVSAAATRVAAGRGEQVEVLRAQGEILKVQADREMAEADRRGAAARLIALLDRDPDDPLGSTAVPGLAASLPALPLSCERKGAFHPPQSRRNAPRRLLPPREAWTEPPPASVGYAYYKVRFRMRGTARQRPPGSCRTAPSLRQGEDTLRCRRGGVGIAASTVSPRHARL